MPMISILFALLCFINLSARETKKLLNFGSGVYDIISNPNSALFQCEYRSFLKCYPAVRPLSGAMITTNAAFYIYSGMAFDIFLGKSWILTPSFAPGLYFKGHGKDLFFPLEFRSSLELSYELPNQGRLGGQFYHISNASMGKKNPGVEALVFFYSYPL